MTYNQRKNAVKTKILKEISTEIANVIIQIQSDITKYDKLPYSINEILRLCPICQILFIPERKSKVYCSDKCRNSYHRNKVKQSP